MKRAAYDECYEAIAAIWPIRFDHYFWTGQRGPERIVAPFG